MRKPFVIFLLLAAAMLSSCNSYQIVRVTDTPVPTKPPMPTYTPLPTYTPQPTLTPRPSPTPFPTDLALHNQRPDNTTCLTEDMWVDGIRKHTDLDPEFILTDEESNYDQIWTYKTTNEGIQETYALFFKELDGCIYGAGSGVIIRSDTTNYSKRDLYFDLVRGFFSDTDGGSWFKEKIRACVEGEDIFEDKYMNDGSAWRIICEDFNSALRVYSLTIRVAE